MELANFVPSGEKAQNGALALVEADVANGGRHKVNVNLAKVNLRQAARHLRAVAVVALHLILEVLFIEILLQGLALLLLAALVAAPAAPAAVAAPAAAAASSAPPADGVACLKARFRNNVLQPEFLHRVGKPCNQ